MSQDIPNGSTVSGQRRLDLSISPNRSLGSFRLGMSIWDTFNYLRDQQRFIPSVDFKYSEEDPIDLDTHINLPQNGLTLRFDGPTQQLKSIECFDLSKVRLTYGHTEISSRKVIATFLLVYKSFGPTYPGVFNEEKNTYDLSYPGLTFTFPIPPEHINTYKTSSSELPLEFPDGTSPIASHLYVFQGSQDRHTASVPSLSKVIESGEGNREIEHVNAEPTKGVTIIFAQPISTTNTTTPTQTGTAAANSTPSNSTPSTAQILLSISTPQDLLADLGKPSKVFYKEEDKMRIHSGAEGGEGIGIANSNPAGAGGEGIIGTGDDGDPTPPTDYFYNYFHYGLDVLFDGTTHTCKKIVLHGNVPGHYDFGRYKRCPFDITFPPIGHRSADRSQQVRTAKKSGANSSYSSSPSNISSSSSSSSLSTTSISETIITAKMKLADIQLKLPRLPTQDGSNQHSQQRPVIFNRGSSKQNPFSSSYLTGLDDGVVFEVCKNGCLAGIVLF